ncbi:MAG: rod shape-determining protein MreC [bacterium]
MRENRLILWIVLGAFFITLLNLPDPFTLGIKSTVREAMAPLQMVMTDFWRGVRESASSVRGYRRLLKENQQMSAEMARLLGEVRDLKLREQENEQLRVQLAFSQRARRLLIPCEVIARDREGWWQTVRLSKGAEDGIAPDMAVVSVDGLIGRTVEVSPHTCDVLLVSDPGCKVSARILRTGTFGIVSGRGPSWKGQVVCRMEFINKNSPVVPGDEVMTSGLGGLFPKGLVIGYVDQVFTDMSGLYQYADVIVKADLGMLQYAFVVTGDVAASLFEAVGESVEE